MSSASRQFLLAAFLLYIAAGVRASESDARYWLERMQVALSELAYRGEFTYLRDGKLSSLAVTRAHFGGLLHERLVHLDGPQREILRVGEQVSCLTKPADPMLKYLERKPRGAFARTFAPGVAALGGRLPVRYHAQIEAMDRIAGQPAVRVAIEPDDSTRYGYRLWLQDPTGMLLRADLIGEDGEALETFQFVHLELGIDVSLRELIPGKAAGLVRRDFEVMPVIDTPVENHGWEARWLPTGFEMAAATLQPLPRRPVPVQTLRYSDGVASLSVFVEPTWSSTSWSRRRGATSAVMHRLEVARGDRYLVTVIGEVPIASARRVAAAVRLRK